MEVREDITPVIIGGLFSDKIFSVISFIALISWVVAVISVTTASSKGESRGPLNL